MSIGRKISWLVVVMVLGTALAIGGIVYLQFDAMTAALQRESMMGEVRTEADRLSVSIGELEHDIRWLSGYSSNMNNVSEKMSRQVQYDTVTTMCTYLMESKPFYDQVRLIGPPPEGKEVIRINRTGGRVEMVPDEELQSKGHRDYYQEALREGSREYALSAINLNRERGEIEIPYKPTIRAVGRLEERVRESGLWVAVINLNFRELMDELLPVSRMNYVVFLANADGDYLYHPEREKEFGYELGKRIVVADDYPNARAFFAERKDEYVERFKGLSTSRGDLLYLYRFYPFESEPERALVVGAYARYDQIVVDTWWIAARSVVGVVLLILCGSGLGWLIAGRITGPLSRVVDGISGFGRKEAIDGGALPVDMKNEVGELARTFKGMVERIQEREQAILNLNEDLSFAHEELAHFAKVSSHELREPVKRIASLADMLRDSRLLLNQVEYARVLGHLSFEVETIVSQLRSYRRYIHVGELASQRELCSLNDIVSNELAVFEQMLIDRSVKVAIEQLPRMHVCPELIAELFRELFGNAFKYSRKDQFALFVAAHMVAEDTWEFEVCNTHSSIPESELGRVVLPFFRLEKDQAGSGMGLAIVNHIAKAYGGRVWLESDEDFVAVKFTLRDQANFGGENDD